MSSTLRCNAQVSIREQPGVKYDYKQHCKISAKSLGACQRQVSIRSRCISSAVVVTAQNKVLECSVGPNNVRLLFVKKNKNRLSVSCIHIALISA